MVDAIQPEARLTDAARKTMERGRRAAPDAFRRLSAAPVCYLLSEAGLRAYHLATRRSTTSMDEDRSMATRMSMDTPARAK